MSIRFECFGMTILKATAVNLSAPGDEEKGINVGGCLRLTLPNDGSITLFMPFETAEEYANAINTCNREHM